MKKHTLLLGAAALSIIFASCAVEGAELAKELGTIGVLTGTISQDTNKKIQDASKKTIEAETTSFTLEEQYYIGRGIAASILSYYPLLENEEATRYVNNITNTLVLNYGANDIYNGFHTAILDSNELNAFATPGGHILITKGLIKAAGNEEALAAALAHELGHIQNDHSIRSIREDRKVNASMAILDASMQTFADTQENNENNLLNRKIKDPDAQKKIKTKLRELEASFEDMLDDSVNTMINSGYSQKFEFEADATALEILEASGYNVYGMQDMLEKIQADTSSDASGFGKTHPKPELRMKALSEKYSSLKKYKTAPERTERYKKITSSL